MTSSSPKLIFFGSW